MKEIKYCNLLMLALIVLVFGQVQPNYVRTISHLEEGDEGIVSTVYYDGLGREIQSQRHLNESNTDIVSVTEYDDAGRVSKKYLPFAYNTDKHYYDKDLSIDNSDQTGFYDSQPYITGNKSHLYSEIDYYDDPLNRVKATDAPGQAFSFSENHYIRKWYLSTVKDNDGENINFDINGFVLLGESETDNISLLERLIDGTESGFENTTHYLTVTKDPDGNFTQSMQDIWGNTVMTWSQKPDITNSDGTVELPANYGNIVAEYRYDIMDNILEEIPPVATNDLSKDIESTQYQYNTLGQLIWKKTPDAGEVYYEYDAAGRLVKTIDANMSEASTDGIEKSLVYEYDNHDRIIKIKTQFQSTNMGLFKNHVLYIYDNPDNASIYLDDIPAVLTENEYHNTRGKLVAAIALNDDCDFFDCSQRIVDAYSYNDDGFIATKYKVIPGLAYIQRFEYEYNLVDSQIIPAQIII